MLGIDDGADPAAAARFETDFANASTRFAPERTPVVLEQLATRMSLQHERGAASRQTWAHNTRVPPACCC